MRNEKRKDDFSFWPKKRSVESLELKTVDLCQRIRTGMEGGRTDGGVSGVPSPQLDVVIISLAPVLFKPGTSHSLCYRLTFRPH